MLTKFGLIIRKIFYFIFFILFLCFMITNTEKVEVQIVPFLYSMNIRIYFLVMFSFLFGILCCKITDFIKKLFDIFGKIKDFILRKKTNMIAIVSILNIFFFFNGCSSVKNTNSSSANIQSVYVKDNTIFYNQIKDKNNKQDLKTLISSIKGKKKDKLLYDLGTEFAMVYKNNLYSIDKQTKTIKNKQLSSVITSKISFDNKYLYFITANNNLYFLNRENFNIDFIYYESAETTMINNIAPIVYNNYIIALFNGNKLVVINKNNGSTVLEKFLEKNEIINENNITVADNSITINKTKIPF